ncbi:hypothetical protein [Streptomyces qinglanensis]|uniref:hypothetical protein n=1 Tax=Streptomyces qinglanensis TaxID=943816 RepID=UPI003D755D45
MRRKLLACSLLSVTAVLLLIAGLLTWWNTNFLGDQRFCGKAFSSSEIDEALEGAGRLEQRLSYERKSYIFHCQVEQSSKFIDSPDSGVEVATRFMAADDPFLTRVWQNRGRMAFALSGLPGGATEQQAWILVPSSCWKKIPAKPDFVPFVTARVQGQTARPEALFRLARRGVQRIMKNVGCSSADLRREKISDLTSEDVHSTKIDNVCRKPGFTLPDSALFPGSAEPGRERVTHPRSSTVWSCDLYLQSEKQPSLTFFSSSDENIVAAMKRQGISPAWDHGEVVRCEQGDFYVSLFAHDPYSKLYDREHRKKARDVVGTTKKILSSLARAEARAQSWTGCSF